ncbi:hypothetical protein Q8A73_015560 [Channa argus]|nr:hypothetical protein Q8A73_015560 [Channa argus]
MITHRETTGVEEQRRLCAKVLSIMARPALVTPGAQVNTHLFIKHFVPQRPIIHVALRQRPETGLGATALAATDPHVTLHLLKEGYDFGSDSGQQEGAAGTGLWTRSTATLPAPDRGLRSVSYYPRSDVAMPTGHETY